MQINKAYKWRNYISNKIDDERSHFESFFAKRGGDEQQRTDEQRGKKKKKGESMVVGLRGMGEGKR